MYGVSFYHCEEAQPANRDRHLTQKVQGTSKSTLGHRLALARVKGQRGSRLEWLVGALPDWAVLNLS